MADDADELPAAESLLGAFWLHPAMLSIIRAAELIAIALRVV
ncbi:MAG: hypothetical protein QNL98_03990 [Mycobacterium sp.]